MLFHLEMIVRESLGRARSFHLNCSGLSRNPSLTLQPVSKNTAKYSFDSSGNRVSSALEYNLMISGHPDQGGRSCLTLRFKYLHPNTNPFLLNQCNNGSH
jgi:hypothetical protein